MPVYTLLTGATGLVGNYLLRDLLRTDHRLALVVRPTKRASAQERIESTLQTWERQLGECLPRPIVFAGDMAEEDLGLSTDARRWIAANCGRILHNAAILTFRGSDRKGEPWRTNFDGTRRTLELCRRVGLRDFHYVSTAYVCGSRQGVVREDELDVGQDYRNDYEHSKCLAEKAVRAAPFLDPPTIYRPVVIAGDSRTGYTNTYHGLLVYMRLVSIALGNTPVGSDGRRHTPMRLPMTGDEQRNVVPVEWVSQVLSHLIDLPAARGRTFHLSPRVPITARNLFDAAYSYYNSYGVEYCGPDWSGDSSKSMFEDMYSFDAAAYRDYEITDPSFDTTNLQRFAGHLPCPAIDEEVLHRYWRFGDEDRWGKRPRPKYQVNRWAKDVLEAALATFDPMSSRHLLGRTGILGTIGLDVVGPGGSQWHISYDGQGGPTARPGLPTSGEPVVRLTVDELAEATGADRVPVHSEEESARETTLPLVDKRRSVRLVQSLLTQGASDYRRAG